MGKNVKCQHCELTDTPKEEMELVAHTSKTGRTTTKKYYHKDCYEEYLKKQAFIDEENSKKDRLNEVIKAIHKIDFVPDSFWYLIQDIRNGNYTHNRKKKIYKEGFSYDIISETYIYVRHEIRRYKKIKNIESANGELRYGLAIVKDKIMYVRDQFAKQEEKKKYEKIAQENSRPDERSEVVVEFKKKKVDDFSAFLD